MPRTHSSHPAVRFRATLAQVAAAVGARHVNEPDLLLEGVTTDSRDVASGSRFVALRGSRFDGHEFVAEAGRRGAAAARVEESSGTVAAHIPAVSVENTLVALGHLARWHRDLFQIQIVAITGSSGKSTTKELTAAVLVVRWMVHKTSAT